MSLRAVTPSSSLADRQRAVADAFRSARAVPQPKPLASAPAPAPQVAAVDPSLVDSLRVEVRRLTERLERVENKVDLIRDGDEAPLAWPVEVETDNRLEVPPLEVKRSNSPAFDVLLGPSRTDSARRDAS